MVKIFKSLHLLTFSRKPCGRVKDNQEQPIHPKYYGHINSLGFNCEVSYQFFQYFGFVESSLFAWASTGDLQNIIEALKNLNLICKGALEPPNQYIPLWKDLNTNVYFHGKAKHKIFKENRLKEMAADKAELLKRIEYLKNKFIQTAQDGKANLYIYKCPINDYTSPSEIKNKINKLYQLLETICSNQFDLLCIFKEGFIQEEEITQNKGKIFIRNIQNFAPEIDVTIKDKKIKQYWAKIFDEFKPNFKLKKKRKFKFE